ncbi:hypothetical protein C9927_02950 [Pseudidiomarina aestuarii]|uniref:Uncharacterized protein n=1 Tax=Pseudidiomarina aestuarii TaxID=624146 RepID=A0A2T4CVM9_9GAMM|nr:hypothetical protein C9940_05285 [Pseudidiomarina aestuarii]PTB88892.1 hypothetical protein C9927_02950 [Pseudidiomarina aestuarii]PTB89569.1 hypothetical protein C9928_03135 [Pseudidiomarina aestuarii]
MNIWLRGMITVLILTYLGGCSDPATERQQASQMNGLDNATDMDTAAVKFSITPARPQPEQPISIQLTLPADWQPQASQLVAITMYMGSLPVVWEADDSAGVWHTTFQVGACAEPQMEWQLRVPLQTPHGQEFLFFPLITYIGDVYE